MVHHRKLQRLKVGHVAGYMKGDDLTFAFIQRFVANGEAFENDAALRRAIELPDNVLPGFQIANMMREREDSVAFCIRQLEDGTELADERM